VPVEVPKGVQRVMVEQGNFIPQAWAVASNGTLGGMFIGRRATTSNKAPSRSRGYPSPPNAAPTVTSIVAGVATADAIATGQPEPPGQQSNELEEKLHRAIFAIVEKSKNKEALSSEESALIRDGKAEVQVWLTEKTDETMAQLKELGFEVISDAKNSKIVIGRLPIEKLEALAKFKFVKYVAPQR